MKINKLFLFINGLFIYLYWWVSFWGASVSKYYIGPILAIGYFIIHFFIIKDKKKEFKYMLFCIIFGFLLESLFYYTDFINYKGILTEKYSIIPLWVITLWAGYALTVFHSFKWLYGRYYLSLFIGGFFAPLIYVSGNGMGCIIFKYDIMTSYLILLPIWSVSMLLLNYVSVKINEN